MLAKIRSAASFGLQTQLIEVECDISNGLPGLVVVGLGDKAVGESRDRIRSALANSHLSLPPKRLTINLAPADFPKDGTSYDLPMAIAILAASQQLRCDLRHTMFFGELALDGSLRGIRGALAACQAAKQAGCTEVFIPAANTDEAALIDGIKIYPAKNLLQIFRHLTGEEAIPAQSYRSEVTTDVKITTDMADIYAQDVAKRCLEISAAGNHNLLLAGPPGSGKTMLANALPGILPPPTGEETVEIAKLHSLAGRFRSDQIGRRPFRQPHHSSSMIALTGGGSQPKPGEISLSHRGVLLLDELPEFSRAALEALRQPLEDGYITVSRAAGHVTYPASFILVATTNPCPCGYLGDVLRGCDCSHAQIQRYKRRLSGPLLDRIDLSLNVQRVKSDQLTKPVPAEDSRTVAERVIRARSTQYGRLGEGRTNDSMTSAEAKRHCPLPPDAKQLAATAVDRLGLSARAYFKAIKVARTIADLSGDINIRTEYLAEALQYRATV